MVKSFKVLQSFSYTVIFLLFNYNSEICFLFMTLHMLQLLLLSPLALATQKYNLLLICRSFQSVSHWVSPLCLCYGISSLLVLLISVTLSCFSSGSLKAARAASTVLCNMFQYNKLHKDFKLVRPTIQILYT